MEVKSGIRGINVFKNDEVILKIDKKVMVVGRRDFI